MKEGIQTNFPDAELREYGCYFFDILKMAENDTGNGFSEDGVLRIFENAKATGAIGPQCFVNDAAALYNLASVETTYKTVVKTTEKPASGQYIICNKKPMYTHFTLWDGKKIWDSLDPKRPGAAGYKPDSYRVFRYR